MYGLIINILPLHNIVPFISARYIITVSCMDNGDDGDLLHGLSYPVFTKSLDRKVLFGMYRRIYHPRKGCWDGMLAGC